MSEEVKPEYEIIVTSTPNKDEYMKGAGEPQVWVEVKIPFEDVYGPSYAGVRVRKNPHNCGIAELGYFGISSYRINEGKAIVKEALKIAYSWGKGLIRATTIPVRRHHIEILESNGFRKTGEFRNPNSGNTVLEYSHYRSENERTEDKKAA